MSGRGFVDCFSKSGNGQTNTHVGFLVEMKKPVKRLNLARYDNNDWKTSQPVIIPAPRQLVEINLAERFKVAAAAVVLALPCRFISD